MIQHSVLITSTPNGYLPSCTCGWRALQFLTYEASCDESDEHERDAMMGRLNKGHKPSPRTAARQYRENSQNPVYTDAERAQWKTLAEELEAVLGNDPILEGQTSLFD